MKWDGDAVHCKKENIESTKYQSRYAFKQLWKCINYHTISLLILEAAIAIFQSHVFAEPYTLCFKYV